MSEDPTTRMQRLFGLLDPKNPNATSSIDAVLDIRRMLGSVSEFVLNGTRYGLYVTSEINRGDLPPWRLEEIEQEIEPFGNDTIDPQLAGAIQQTRESEVGFTYAVKLTFTIDHFEHNERMVSQLEDVPPPHESGADADGIGFDMVWECDVAEEAFDIVDALSTLPLTGTVGISYMKIPADIGGDVIAAVRGSAAPAGFTAELAEKLGADDAESADKQTPSGD